MRERIIAVAENERSPSSIRGRGDCVTAVAERIEVSVTLIVPLALKRRKTKLAPLRRPVGSSRVGGSQKNIAPLPKMKLSLVALATSRFDTFARDQP